MAALRVGIIGCGMSHWHARGYEATPGCDIVALADVSAENARAFQEEHGGECIYTDYREMLRDARLDIVSICTWPHLHAEMTIAAAEAGVRAIHCEKPMAPTWGEAQRMAAACEARGVQLTFNHQRRFASQFIQARELRCPDLFDWGTHWFDMCHFYNDEAPATWVQAAVDFRDGRSVFGIALEGQGLSHAGFANGVHAILLTGHNHGQAAWKRIVGMAGTIEVEVEDGPLLRVWGHSQTGWETIAVPDEGSALAMVPRGIRDLVDALRAGREPELAARRALRATELSLASYESARRGERVDLPLTGELAVGGR